MQTQINYSLVWFVEEKLGGFMKLKHFFLIILSTVLDKVKTLAKSLWNDVSNWILKGW